MSVIVKNMKMPKTCQECDLYIEDACYAKGYRDYRRIMDKSKPDDCPLIELPPHGRLIDVDKFKADYSMKDDCAECEKELQGSSRACEYDRIYSKMDFCQWIDNAPTVNRSRREQDVIDTIIAFVLGAWIGACLAIIVAALLIGNDYVDSDM